jgi:beta-lactamase regulating signal transducer with metallopeptidase domain
MSFTYRVRLPGELISAETGVEVGDDTIEWDAPLDGTTMSVRTQTVQRPAGEGSSWAGPLATISLIALVAWIVLASAFVIFVALARRRKQRRRETRLRRLERDRVS